MNKLAYIVYYQHLQKKSIVQHTDFVRSKLKLVFQSQEMLEIKMKKFDKGSWGGDGGTKQDFICGDGVDIFRNYNYTGYWLYYQYS